MGEREYLTLFMKTTTKLAMVDFSNVNHSPVVGTKAGFWLECYDVFTQHFKDEQ